MIDAGPASAAGTSNEQCRNGSATNPQQCNNSTTWQNGNLGSSNSHYKEGDSAPQRALIETTQGTHTLHINYETTRAGKHAYDYLTSFDYSERTAVGCFNMPCVAGTPGEIPPDTSPNGPAAFQANDPNGPQQIKIWNGNVTAVQYVGNVYTSPRTLAVTFTANSTNKVVIAWGAHFASGLDWGFGNGAGSISGSPFHVETNPGPGSPPAPAATVGSNKQLSTSAGAIPPPPAMSTLASNASPSVGTAVTDTLTLPSNAAGEVKFFICGPSPVATPTTTAGCPTGGTLVGTPITTTGGNVISAGFTPTVAGRYCFRAEYVPTATAPYSSGNHTNNTTECFNAQPVSLSITKVATGGVTTVNAGDPIGYTITVSNTGTGTANGVAVQDSLPTNTGLSWTVSSSQGGCTSMPCTLGSIPGGGSATITLTSPTTKDTCPSVSNSASFTSTNGGSGSAGPAVITVNCPALTIAKTTSTPSVNAGDNIAYLITVGNTGPGLARNVTVTDVLPVKTGVSWTVASSQGGCTTMPCNLGDIASGGSATITLTSGTTKDSCGPINNTASVAGSNGGGNPSAGPVLITVNCAVLTIAKTADASPVNATDEVGYKITVTNTGDGVARGVDIDDVLPATSGTWVIDRDGSDATTAARCSITGDTLHCDQDDLAGKSSVLVHVTSTTTPADCPGINNLSAKAISSNDGSAEVTNVPITINCADLELVKSTSTGTVSAGDPISFTLTLTNRGPGVAYNAVIDDTLPSSGGLVWSTTTPGCTVANNVLHCDAGNLADDGSFAATVTATTSSANCPTNTLQNTGTGDAANDDVVTSNTSNITINCAVIGLTKTPDASPVNAGDAIGFLLTITNSGDGEARGVVLTDTLPTTPGTSWSVDGGTAAATCEPIVNNTLTCNVGTVPARAGGVNGTATVHITSPTARGVCATVTNRASVTAANDGSASTPQEGVSITLRCADLSLVKSADIDNTDRTTSVPGDGITYTLTVTNAGSGPARDVVITEPIPTGTTFKSCSNSCSPQGPAVTSTEWTIAGPIAANGGTASVTLTVEVGTTDECEICNVATASTPDRVGQTATSNRVCVKNTPGPHPERANASGSAYAALVNAPLLDVNNTKLPSRNIDTSRDDIGSESDADAVANRAVPADGSLLRATLLSAASESEITAQPAQAVHRSTSEVLGVNLVNGLVRADVVRADAYTVATGSGSTFSSTGSTFTNLVVNGVAMTDVAPHTRVNLPAEAFGPESYVLLYERTGTTKPAECFPPVAGDYCADLAVNMIRVHITELAPLKAPVDIVVANAVAHSDFPQTVLCVNSPTQAVSGHAFVGWVDTTPSQIATHVGLSYIPSHGGHESQHVASASVPPSGALLTTAAGDSTSSGSLGSAPDFSNKASSYAQAADVCVLKTADGCTIGAQLVRSQANSTAGPGGASSNDNGTGFVNLTIAGQPVTGPIGRNTIRTLRDIGVVVLNEQFCYNEGSVDDGCRGSTHSGLGVRAIRVLVTIADNPLGLPLGAEIIVAQAHSGAEYHT